MRRKNTIDFIDHVIGRFPFRFHTIRTDKVHEFHAKFHGHLGDLGIPMLRPDTLFIYEFNML